MKKLIVLLIFAFSTTSAMANTLSQSDFYGTWKFTDNNETIVYIITHNSLALIIDNEEPITVNIKSIILCINQEKSHIIIPGFLDEAVLTKQ